MTDSHTKETSGPFLVFDIGNGDDPSGGGTFALDVSHVFQVIEPGHVSPVPLAPPVVLGILNHHGRIVTIVDPALLLDLVSPPSTTNQAVILRHGLRGPARLGLRVSRIWGIVPRGDLATVQVQTQPCVAWAAQAGRRLVHVLALEPLLERLSRLFGSMDSRPSLQGVTV